MTIRPKDFKITMQEFFNGFYAPVLQEKLYIGLRYSRSDTLTNCRLYEDWFSFDSGLSITDWLEKHPLTEKPHSFHFTPALHFRTDTSKASVAGVTGLWLDIDGKSLKNFSYFFKQPFPEFCPSYIIDSGWGVHLYWRFDELVRKDDERWENLEKTLKLFGFLFGDCGADYQSLDFSHLMRLPGSYNCKSFPYQRVNIYKLKDAAYNVDDFIDMAEKYIPSIEAELKESQIEPEPPKKTNSPRSTYTYRGRVPKDCRFMELIEGERNGESLLRWKHWTSVASALYIAYGDDGFDEFFDISIESNSSPDPESEISRAFEAAKNYRPHNCAKLEGLSDCPHIREGVCRCLKFPSQQ